MPGLRPGMDLDGLQDPDKALTQRRSRAKIEAEG